MKISDYLENNVLSILDRNIQYLEKEIKDREKAAEDLFAAIANGEELLAESLALREKLVNLIDLTCMW